MKIKDLKLFAIATFLFVAPTLLCSCGTGSEKEVRQLLNDFATAVENKSRDSIAVMYPDAAKWGDFNKEVLESNVIELTNKGDSVLEVKFEGGQRLLIRTENEGNMTIADSYGILYFDDILTDFGLKTRWIEDSFSDIQKAERFADKKFTRYIMRQLEKDIIKMFKAEFSRTIGDQYIDDSTKEDWIGCEALEYTIYNNSNYEIPANVLKFVARSWYWGDPSDKFTEEILCPRIASHGSVRIKTKNGDSSESDRDHSLELCLGSFSDEICKIYKPKGNEYDDYLKVAAKKSSKKDGVTPDLVFCDLHGDVKSCIVSVTYDTDKDDIFNEKTSLYIFDTSGKETYNYGYGNTKRNKSGSIVSISKFEDKADQQITITYDGLYPIKIKTKSEGEANYNTWDKCQEIVYDENKVKTILKETGEYATHYDTSTTIYKYLEYDSFGNWTKRLCEEKYEERESRDGKPSVTETNYIETRAISYWEDF